MPERPPWRIARRYWETVVVPLTRNKYVVIDVEDMDLAQFNWSAVARASSSGYYAYRTFWATENGRRVSRHEHLHKLVALRAGIPPGLVDHIDGDTLNCRRENLRAATAGQNARNARRRKDNPSGYKGVTPSGDKWIARIRVDGRPVHLGSFRLVTDAAAAYAAAALRLHGSYVRRSELYVPPECLQHAQGEPIAAPAQRPS